ncbi:MAG: complex I NDUFA9 subunit family protein [Sphingomicrobium sp.]
MIDREEELVTVFGGGGFIGRYVCELLLQSGVRVRVVQRDPRQAHMLQPLAQIGQLGIEAADVTRPASVRNAVRGASAVINLAGAFGRAMQSVHVEGARNIAEAVRDHGAGALVHLSAIGADPASPSAYGRSKSAGEQALRGAFPAATIIRPSLVFGPDDKLTNRFAAMARLPLLPVLAANTKFQPVYVRDLARAIAAAALDRPAYSGKTFEIGGPQRLSMVDLHREILGLTGQKPELVRLPDAVGSLVSRFGWLPAAPLDRDQWLMLQSDNVPAAGAPGLEAFGIKPTPLAAVGPEWLGRFQPGGKFAGRRIHLTPAA